MIHAQLTCCEVLNDAGTSGMIDDVRSVVEVQEIVPTVEAPVAVDVLQR